MTTTSLAAVYCTTGQAAARLGVNRLTVQRWVNGRRLSGERVGQTTLIPISEVDALKKERDRLFVQGAD